MQAKHLFLLFTGALVLLLLVALGNILFSGYQGNLFPLAVTLPTILLCFLIMYWEWRGVRSRLPVSKSKSSERDPKEVKVYLWFAGFLATTLVLGFGLAAPIFVLGYLLVIGKKGVGFSLLYTAIISTIVYFILNRTLGMSWPSGLLVF